MVYYAMLPSPTVSSWFHMHVCNINLIDKPFCDPSFVAEIAECLLFVRWEDVHRCLVTQKYQLETPCFTFH